VIWQRATTRGLPAPAAAGLALASLLVVQGLAAATPDRLRVQSIAIDGQGPATRVELRLTRPGDYSLFTLTGPHRVVVDISTAALGTSALPLPTASGAIRQIRVAHRPGGNLRIVFDVSEAMRPSATLAAVDGIPRLSIEMRPVSWVVSAPRSPSPASSVSSAVPARKPSPVAQAVPAAPLVPPATPAPPPVVRVPEERREIVVVVDAGHGGHDPGAHGRSGLREKDVTLAISRRLVERLNAEPGMRGVLTRRDDRFLGLRERMERARSANADLFVSIHADAAQNRSARGSTVYVLSEKAASDEASRRLAAQENAALIGGVELGDKDPVLASVLMDLSQNASISSSIAVGDAVLRRMGRLGRLHRTSVQQAPFMVLKSPDVPSILVETAYISNPVDEQNLRSARHQEALAGAVLEGVRNYFASNPPVGRPVTTLAAVPSSPRASGSASPRRHVIRRGDTLSGIAVRYNVSVRSLRSANGLRSDTVMVGQTLRIPRESI
jgi:N-acetylmuramoyl-L-alanine amidase